MSDSIRDENPTAETSGSSSLVPIIDEQDRRIGSVLMASGKLSAEAIERIVAHQNARGLRFGEAAIELGLIGEADLQAAIAGQFGFSYLVPGGSRVSEEVILAYQPLGDQAESLRALRGEILAWWRNAGIARQVLTVVSAERGEGRSHLAANLAVAFSQLDEPTLLIDADMRHPRQHSLFGLDGQFGLSILLSGRGGRREIPTIPGLPRLSVLPAGEVPPNPQELLARPNFADLLDRLGEKYRVIIIDTPAVGECADALTTTLLAGAALLVVRKDHSRGGAVNHLVERFKRAHAKLIGITAGQF